MDNRRTVDNRLAHMDQVSFLGVRALGYGTLAQVVWLYNRQVDIDGLSSFHRNLGHGLLGRRIERSPLPFARDRWVLSRGRDDIDIAKTPRARGELNAWAYERARLPIDPEFGPGWHLGVLGLHDGGTAISLVASHTLVDGLGLIEVIADAAKGRTRDLVYPPPGSRSRRRAVLDDARQTLASVPELAHALKAGVRLARQGRKEFASSIAGAPPGPRTARDDRPVEVPALVAFVDVDQWDACAARLGGTSNSLFAGFAANLGARMGRHADDGSVALAFPVGQRTLDDTRGNAMTFANVTVDPANAASDLTEIRGRLKQALTERAAQAYELLAPLPLAAMTPTWAARKLVGVGLGTSALPVGCSNLGPLDLAVIRPDGSDADYAYGRLIEPGIRKRALEAMGGQLFVASGRIPGKVFISVVAYRPGRHNSAESLRELVTQTFGDFGLTAEII